MTVDGSRDELRTIVDPSHKQGGGTALITPLLRNGATPRSSQADRAAQSATSVGTIRIIADKRTPYRTLTEVIYTLGQAEFKALHFVLPKAGE